MRYHIDILLDNKELTDSHIDAYATILEKKVKLEPDLHHKFVFVSSQHYSSAQLNWESYKLIKHITKDSFSEAEYIFISVNYENTHWLLLAGSRSRRTWHILDSLPSESHKKNIAVIISSLYKDLKKKIKTDIRKWRVSEPQGGVPKQSNVYDCGMFVCKYMDRLLLSKVYPLNWQEHNNWQDLMPSFRTTFAINLCRRSAKYQEIMAKTAAAKAEAEAKAIEAEVRAIDEAVAKAKMEAEAKPAEEAN